MVILPTYKPHMGNIWKTAVKLTKYHIKCVVQNTTFTFEEFTTLLSPIEAILNSRPIKALAPNSRKKPNKET